MKVLLAVDGSPCTRHMLAYIAAHDELLGPGNDFTALTVVPPIPSYVARRVDAAVLTDYHAEQAEEVLAPVRQFAQQQGWNFKTQHVVGHPGHAIAELAEAGRYDLLVLGSHGHGAVAGAVLGSVAMSTLSRCRTPVLVVR